MKKENTNESVGDRIKKIRGDMALGDFAELLGVGRTTLFRYEKNERLPDAEFLIKLNMLYKVQPLWLLTGHGADITGEKLTPEEAALLDNYRHSPPEGQAAIKATSAAFAQPAKVKKGGKKAV